MVITHFFLLSHTVSVLTVSSLLLALLLCYRYFFLQPFHTHAVEVLFFSISPSHIFAALTTIDPILLFCVGFLSPFFFIFSF